MRKTKKWLLTGVALLLIGALIWVFGMSVLKWDFYALDTTDYVEKSWACEEAVTRVEIDTGVFPLIVQKGDGVRLTYYEEEGEPAELTLSDGVLTVTSGSDGFRLFKAGMFQLKQSKCKWTLTVPDGMEIAVKSMNGDVRISDLAMPAVTLKVTNLTAVLTRCNIASFTADATNADIVMAECDGNTFNMHSTNLDLVMRQSQFASAEITGTNVDAEIENTACETLLLRATNLDAEIDRLTVHTLTLKGTNLDADVTVAGQQEEYTVVGTKYAQTGTTDKKIEIGGTNKDVKLRFV